MASVSSLPTARVEHRGLPHWMDKVLKELDKLRESPDKDAVHDLRVAIRRCRSVAQVMREIDPSPAWRELRHLPKKLFRKLGEVRDTQVMDTWVADHGAENDKIRNVLHQYFAKREPQLTAEAVRLAERFDTKAWKRLDGKLRKRMRLVPADSLAAECLAAERYEDAKELHGKALRAARRPESWHALRIGLKKLRYTTESLLPEKYQAWSDNLKKMQDLLGDVHDLDVLAGIIEEQAKDEPDGARKEWGRMIQRECDARLDGYAEITHGKESVWNEWKRGLPQGARLQSAALARLRATARATDAHPRRAAQLSRLSTAVFDALMGAKVAPIFTEKSIRRVFRAAARLNSASIPGSRKSPRKAARRFLRELPVPPTWTAEEWELLAWTVRYQRGPEPKFKDGAFTRVHGEQRKNVCALAGVIRLARGLRKCGVENCGGLRAEKSAEATILEVPGLADSAENAARLAAGKHLLESYLGSPIILKTMVKESKVLSLPIAHEEQFAYSAASD